MMKKGLLLFVIATSIIVLGKGVPPSGGEDLGIRVFDGFERNADDIDSWYPVVQLGAAKTSPASHIHSGSQSLNSFQAIGTSVGNGSNRNSLEITDGYASVYLLVNGDCTVNKPLLRFLNNNLADNAAQLYLTTDEKLEVRARDGVTDPSTGSTVLNSQQWYRIDFYAQVGATGNYELRIDGQVELSGTKDFSTENFEALRGGDSGVGQGNIAIFDDLVLTDDAFFQLGQEYGIATLYPNGDGNYTEWTGSYTDIDDIGAHDDNSTTITTSNNNDRQLVTLQTFTDDAESISAVQINGILWKTVAPTLNCRFIDRLGGTDRPGTTFDIINAGTLTGSALQWHEVFTTKPGGGSFTIEDLSSYEIGIQHQQSQSRQANVSAINLDVLYLVPSGIPPNLLSPFSSPRRNPILRM